MNTILPVCCILVLSLLSGCREKPSDDTSASPDKTTATGNTRSAETTKPVPFTPPGDSAISADQMMAWSTCNPLLDSLTFMYADSFKTEDPAGLLRYQEDFINAQDRICVRAGLPGGYQEYKWILQHMGLPKNRSILESANAKTF